MWVLFTIFFFLDYIFKLKYQLEIHFEKADCVQTLFFKDILIIIHLSAYNTKNIDGYHVVCNAKVKNYTMAVFNKRRDFQIVTFKKMFLLFYNSYANRIRSWLPL